MVYCSYRKLKLLPEVCNATLLIFAVFWNVTSLNWVKGNEPNAVIVHLDKSLVDAERSVRPTGVTVCLAIFLRCEIPARFQFYYHGPDKAGYTLCDR